MFVIFFSCISKEEKIFKKIEGIWVVEEVIHLNQNITEKFYINTFIFEKGKLFNYVIIPQTDSYNGESALMIIRDENGSTCIEIESLNKSLNGIYKIDFYKNTKNNFTVLKLTSKNTSIKLNKLPGVSDRIF